MYVRSKKHFVKDVSEVYHVHAFLFSEGLNWCFVFLGCPQCLRVGAAPIIASLAITNHSTVLARRAACPVLLKFLQVPSSDRQTSSLQACYTERFSSCLSWHSWASVVRQHCGHATIALNLAAVAVCRVLESV